MFGQRVSPSNAELEQLIAKYQLNVSPDISVLPILISVELWKKELTVREEEIMEYALRNAAAELIVQKEIRAVLFKIVEGIISFCFMKRRRIALILRRSRDGAKATYRRAINIFIVICPVMSVVSQHSPIC